MRRAIQLRTFGFLGACMLALALGGFAWARSASGANSHPSVPELVASLQPQLSDEQNDLLADGVLTSAEYEGAIDRVATCTSVGGLTVVRHPGAGVGGSTQLEVQGDTRVMPVDEINAAYTHCIDRFTGKLGIVWAEEHRPTAAEADASQAAIDACLVAHGQPGLVGHTDEVLGAGAKYRQGSPEFEAVFACLP
jgi:hypothetical protein